MKNSELNYDWDAMISEAIRVGTFDAFVQSLTQDEAKWLQENWLIPVLKRENALN